MEENRNPLDKRITYCESPVYAVAKSLREKGYEIASCIGMYITEPEEEGCIGILSGVKSVQKSFLGFKWNKILRSLHLGTLWFHNGRDNTNDWVLDVFGRKNLPELTELVKGLSGPHGAHVQVRLGSEHSKTEIYQSDYHW